MRVGELLTWFGTLLLFWLEQFERGRLGRVEDELDFNVFVGIGHDAGEPFGVGDFFMCAQVLLIVFGLVAGIAFFLRTVFFLFISAIFLRLSFQGYLVDQDKITFLS